MKQKIKYAIRRRFPFTARLKSWLIACVDSRGGGSPSYSQTGEDRIVLDLFESLNIESRTYVDVGANHPTRLSNTYLLYRNGYRGVVVEPNRSLLVVHRRFRPEDVHIGVGCGEMTDVLSFRHATSHVLSGFESGGLKASDFRESEYIPVLPLDVILSKMDIKEIALLSIDVEGFDLQVVLGAKETLKKTRIVVIEGEESDTRLMDTFGESGFRLEDKTLHNLIFVREQN